MFKTDLKFSDVTPEEVFQNRRQFMKSASQRLFAGGVFGNLGFCADKEGRETGGATKNEDGTTLESLATTYNNFYEFSFKKHDVHEKVKSWKLDPGWSVEVVGEVEKPRTFPVEEIKKLGEEERIYRFRCVEAWAMVLPWSGVPLARLLKVVRPKPNAKYVKFYTFSDPRIGPNIALSKSYAWPYTEGLRLDEAMHDLTLLGTGLYGKALPRQNGAPVRLVVPWKYGFKSIKSIVKIELTETQPQTLWSLSAPKEYGFYANVNPKVDHPRWSQAREKIVDGTFFPKKQPTQLFNGYSEVASLYRGMDLIKYF